MGAGRSRGQVLAAFALIIPLALLPVAAWSIEASTAAGAESRLMEVTAQAAEDAAQQIDEARLRAGAGLEVVPAQARVAVAADLATDPGASLAGLDVAGDTVTVAGAVRLPLSLAAIFGGRELTLRASATARIVSGYERPSSRRPFSSRIFSSA